MASLSPALLRRSAGTGSREQRAALMKSLHGFCEASFDGYKAKQLEIAWCLRLAHVHTILVAVNSVGMVSDSSLVCTS